MIVIHVVHDEHTLKYVDYAEAAMAKLATGVHTLRFERSLLRPISPSCASAARRHSIAVQEAMEMSAHCPWAIHVVCDSDTSVVKRGWDEAMCKVLETYDCMGTAYQDVGSRNVRKNQQQTYKGKPNVQWMALRPGPPWHEYRVGDKQLVENFTIKTPEQEETFGLRSGHVLLTDTCWNLPVFMREHGITSLALKNVDEPRVVDACYEEWWLDGEPFVVHQGKSRKNKFRCTQFSADFYAACDQATGLGVR